MSPVLKVKLLSENATAPTKGSEFAAGYDLYASENVVIPGSGQNIAPTDIAVEIPYGTYARVAPRSGLAAKHGISTGAGVIDVDYRGPIQVVLFNHSKTDYKITKGDRIAQLILEVIIPDAKVEVVDNLSDTVRGEGGFGSSGK